MEPADHHWMTQYHSYCVTTHHSILDKCSRIIQSSWLSQVVGEQQVWRKRRGQAAREGSTNKLPNTLGSSPYITHSSAESPAALSSWPYTPYFMIISCCIQSQSPPTMARMPSSILSREEGSLSSCTGRELHNSCSGHVFQRQSK